MSATPTDLENSIQLALEAAAAANDSAEDMARLSADMGSMKLEPPIAEERVPDIS